MTGNQVQEQNVETEPAPCHTSLSKQPQGSFSSETLREVQNFILTVSQCASVYFYFLSPLHLHSGYNVLRNRILPC